MMRLYLNKHTDILRKAAGQGTAGKVTPSEEQSRAEYEASYGKRYEGVAAGEAYDYDDPDEGASWKHSDDDSVVKETKDKQSARTKEAKSSKVVKASDASDMLKSMTAKLDYENSKRLPSAIEAKFLIEYMEYDPALVNKGMVEIRGYMRGLFNDWLCDRLAKSIDQIVPKRRSRE